MGAVVVDIRAWLIDLCQKWKGDKLPDIRILLGMEQDQVIYTDFYNTHFNFLIPVDQMLTATVVVLYLNQDLIRACNFLSARNFHMCPRVTMKHLKMNSDMRSDTHVYAVLGRTCQPNITRIGNPSQRCWYGCH